jgi:hypothetical protein
MDCFASLAMTTTIKACRWVPDRARYARLSETTRNYVFFLAALVAIAAAAVRFSTPSLA